MINFCLRCGRMDRIHAKSLCMNCYNTNRNDFKKCLKCNKVFSIIDFKKCPICKRVKNVR